MPFPADPVPDGNVFLPHHIFLGVFLLLYGFVFVWPHYPRPGAVIALLGLAVAADDVISHAFGILTPGEWIWETFLYGLVSGA